MLTWLLQAVIQNWILHAELTTPCGVLVPQDDAGEELFNVGPIFFLAISEDWRAEVGKYNYFINAQSKLIGLIFRRECE